MESNIKSSPVDFLLNESVKSIPRDSLSSITSDRVDYFNQLVVTVAILKLLTDVSQVMQIEFSLSLYIKQSEVGSAAFLAERISLS